MAKGDTTGQAMESSIEQLLDINRKQSEIISAQIKTIEELRGTIVGLNASLTWPKRRVFGEMGKEYKSIDDRDPKLPFDYDDLEQVEAEIGRARSRATEQITIPKSRTANRTPRRNRVAVNNLPVVTVIIEPGSVDLNRCVKMGKEHIRILKMKPDYLYVKDTVRPTYTLKNKMEAADNGEKAVITVPMSLMPIYKGMPGVSILAGVLLQKYEYHVPFYRQVKQLEHLGMKLSRNTLDGWFRPVCELLRPFHLEPRKKVLAANYLQVDKTTLPAINHGRYKAAKEYIQVVRATVPRLLFFHYDSGSRSRKVATRLLKNFKGYLRSDGHPIYGAFEDRENMCLRGCLAHIRRHIELCKGGNPEYTIQGLKFTQDMYNVKYMADKQELPYEERAESRQRLSEPVLDSFGLWLKNTYPKVLRRSLIGKVVTYTYFLLSRMKPYLHNGRIFMDNNHCEDALGPLVISRKNMLFCGDHEAIENTAIICSLPGSCREYDVNPREWLNDVISKLPYCLAPKSDRNLKELLPDV